MTWPGTRALDGGDQRADGGAQAPVAGAGRQPGQLEGDGGRRAEDVAVRRDDGHGEVAVVDVDGHDRVLPQVIQRCRRGGRSRPARVDVPAAAGRVVADVVAHRARHGLSGDLIAPVANSAGHDRRYRPCGRFARWASGAGSLISSQLSSGCTRIVSLPHGLSFSPSAVRNSRADSHSRRHWSWVSPAAARLFLVRSRAFPPRTTDAVPASSCRSTPASRACSDLRRMVLACRSAGVAYPRVRPALPPAGTASRAPIQPMRACRLDRSARRFCPASRSWSSLVRVIAPAHRDDEAAVSARFRTARDRARPFASSRPSTHRAARSRPASEPRYAPAAHSTASSCAQTRSRARTRAPPGAAATNGAVIGRREAVISPPPARPGRPASKRVHVRYRPPNQGNC